MWTYPDWYFSHNTVKSERHADVADERGQGGREVS